jgi:enamine deaminase RidA (YjgF/YER057c/UK114 family)
MSKPNELPPTPGKFSRIKSIELGDTTLLFISGACASANPPPDTGQQTELVFAKIADLLAEHDASLSDIVKLTVFLADIWDYDKYNAVRNRVFASISSPPASSALEAKLVSPQFLIEIEGIAVTTRKK